MIDWPVRWRGADEKYGEQLKAEAAKKEHCFGQHATVVGYKPDPDTAKDWMLLLPTGAVENFYQGAFTVIALAPPGDEAVLLELRAIRAAVEALAGGIVK